MLLVRFGWRPSHFARSSGAKGLSISEAIQRAGEAKPPSFYAKQVLTATLGINYAEWEENRWRTEAEVLAQLRRAAECAEGRAFRPRLRAGWKISSGPPKQPSRSPDVLPMRRKGGEG